MNGHDLRLSDTDLEATMKGIACTGAHWVRFLIPWNTIEYPQGTFDWSWPDRMVTSANNHGLNVVGILGTSPGWAEPSDHVDNWWTVPDDPSTYATFGEKAAGWYGARVAAWEIWNEPNNSTDFLVGTPRHPSNPSVYGAMVNAIAPRIHNAAPNAQVLMGSLAAAGPNTNTPPCGPPPSSPCVMQPDQFLRQVYQTPITPAAHAAYTAVSYHPYSWNAAPNDPQAINGFYSTPSVFAAMADNGDQGKLIWGTEVGWVVGGSFTAQQQAQVLPVAYQTWHSWGFTGPLLWFTWRDYTPDIVGYGMFDSSGTAQPALGTFGTMASQGYGSLRVNPDAQGVITMDGIARDQWSLAWMETLEGSHTVCQYVLEGRSDPACQTVTVGRGTTTTLSLHAPTRGFLHVQTNPAVGATITVDGIPRDDWGMWTDMAIGSHRVCFGAYKTYRPPRCKTVSVSSGNTTTLTGAYVYDPNAPGPSSSTGVLSVSLSGVHAQTVVDSNPMDTGGLSVHLAPGSHTICVRDVPGWQAVRDPNLGDQQECHPVTVTAGATTSWTATYSASGEIVVATGGVNGSISIDGVVRNNSSADFMSPIGTWRVCFGAVANRVTPLCQMVSVMQGQVTHVVGTYG